MHNHFSEWFLAAGIEMQDDPLQKRWVGVETFTAGRGEIISLVEVFYGFFEGKENFVTSFRAPFKQADGAFRMQDNNQELSVLAGAKLVSIMEGDDVGLGDLAAIALVSCAAQNLRAAPVVGDISERAAKHLNARTLKRTLPDPNADASDDETAETLEQVKRDLAAVTEESNVLWWVFGETSRDTQKPWSDYSVAHAALMAGKELADLIRILPGPAASGAILDRVVKFAKGKPPAQLVLKDAIAESAHDWRQNLIKPFPVVLLSLCPVTHGVKLSLELANGDAWHGALASVAKIHRGGKIAPRLLAYQVFVECLLVSAWQKTN
jgi:hypothetical protein